jgi:hypothetical protein
MALVLTMLASVSTGGGGRDDGQAELYQRVLRRMLETGSSGPKQWPYVAQHAVDEVMR